MWETKIWWMDNKIKEIKLENKEWMRSNISKFGGSILRTYTHHKKYIEEDEENQDYDENEKILDELTRRESIK